MAHSISFPSASHSGSQSDSVTPVRIPDLPGPELFRDATAAVDRLNELYDGATAFLRARFGETIARGKPQARFRAFYPEVRLRTTSFAEADTRLAFGHVAVPGSYATTVTRPDLFRNYLIQQIGLVIENHGQPVEIGPSTTPIPVHFAMAGAADPTVPQEGALDFPLRDVFDVPDLASTNDDIVNGYGFTHEDGSGALAPFTAQRVDYSQTQRQVQ